MKKMESKAPGKVLRLEPKDFIAKFETASIEEKFSTTLEELWKSVDKLTTIEDWCLAATPDEGETELDLRNSAAAALAKHSQALKVIAEISDMQNRAAVKSGNAQTFLDNYTEAMKLVIPAFKETLQKSSADLSEDVIKSIMTDFGLRCKALEGEIIELVKKRFEAATQAQENPEENE